MCASLFNVKYDADFLPKEKADVMLEELKDLSYFVPTFKIRNRDVQPRREIAAYGDPGLVYSFSGADVPALPWNPVLLEIRDQVERYTGCTYNYVLLNKYVDGTSFISQHRDDESCLDATFPLAVVSFGETRTLEFKKKDCDTISLELQHGSIYVVEKPTNEHYTHGIPADASKKNVRISLSFRHVLMSPAKKLKMDDSSPRQEPASLLNEWRLDSHLFVQLRFDKQSLRLHIRKFNELMCPTKQGVVMLHSTWSELCDKLAFYEFKDCFVVNRQLLVASMKEETTLFQQMFDSKVNGYYLKPTFLILDREQLLSLKELMPEITLSFIEALIHELLPATIAAQSPACEEHFPSVEEAKRHLLFCVEENIHGLLNSYFPCTGCMFNDPSQFNHECMMRSFGEKFALYREKTLMNLNVYHIVKRLAEKCLCYYTASFMKDLNILSHYVQNQ